MVMILTQVEGIISPADCEITLWWETWL